MASVPDSPEAFFTQYLPEQFGSITEDLSGRSSAGSVTFRVTGAGEWSLALKDGALVVLPEQQSDVIVQVTLNDTAFAALVVAAAREHEATFTKLEHQAKIIRLITLDDTRVNQVRQIAGSVALSVTDEDAVHQVTITPGAREPNLTAPECRVSCHQRDFEEIQAGKVQPMQLVMTGKMRIEGNAQIPMALMAVLA
ncbi:MAG: SCP2 sterol-binding domain-containing protein [Polyangiaceae bacterium]|nr:SCP2 sterol-binding domain-containing protein [Polyangiaceae bacterium]MCW5789945.1 SCP2 sterol-binding domain-containing protein [Polyangiaceae bacterium]